MTETIIFLLFGLANIPSINMKVAGFMVSTAAFLKQNYIC